MQQAAPAAAAKMSGVREERKRGAATQEKEKEEGKPKLEAATDGGGAPATEATAAPGPVHEPPAPKRIIRTPAPPAPKRATRASTGAPIALTAKGSLYKANKDTGEREKKPGRGRRCGCDRVWGV